MAGEEEELEVGVVFLDQPIGSDVIKPVVETRPLLQRHREPTASTIMKYLF